MDTECEDEECTDDAEIKITYLVGKVEKEEIFCDVHGAARVKALKADPTIANLEQSAYDPDEDEDEDEDEDD